MRLTVAAGPRPAVIAAKRSIRATTTVPRAASGRAASAARLGMPVSWSNRARRRSMASTCSAEAKAAPAASAASAGRKAGREPELAGERQGEHGEGAGGEQGRAHPAPGHHSREEDDEQGEAERPA